MMAAITKENAAGQSGASTRTKEHNQNHIADKAIATVRAKLCHAGGQVLHVAEAGAYFVSTPFGQIKRFDSFESLQVCVDRFEK